MKLFLNWFGNLMQVKKIIALILTIVFAYLSIKGTISAEQFITVFSMVVSFYFGQSSVRQTIAESKNHDSASP
jgi:hypothetical protein